MPMRYLGMGQNRAPRVLNLKRFVTNIKVSHGNSLKLRACMLVLSSRDVLHVHTFMDACETVFSRRKSKSS